MPRDGPKSCNPAHPEPRVYPEQSRREGHERSRRGGKRPGAGAPKGNLNAAKTGQYSKRLRIIARALVAVPEVRDFLLDFSRRQRRERRKAERIAFDAVKDFLSESPDAINPLVAYLSRSLANRGNGHISQK